MANQEAIHSGKLHGTTTVQSTFLGLFESTWLEGIWWAIWRKWSLARPLSSGPHTAFKSPQMLSSTKGDVKQITVSDPKHNTVWPRSLGATRGERMKQGRQILTCLSEIKSKPQDRVSRPTRGTACQKSSEADGVKGTYSAFISATEF